MRDMRELAAEPAIKPLIRVTLRNLDGLNPAHANTPLASITPSPNPIMDNTTDSTT